jgi:hypothetical protein
VRNHKTSPSPRRGDRLPFLHPSTSSVFPLFSLLPLHSLLLPILIRLIPNSRCKQEHQSLSSSLQGLLSVLARLFHFSAFLTRCLSRAAG